eukprot:evm.model.scf_127.10 EVM.evm.TU.scf_127.10   scf_127:123688-125204(-)
MSKLRWLACAAALLFCSRTSPSKGLTVADSVKGEDAFADLASAPDWAVYIFDAADKEARDEVRARMEAEFEGRMEDFRSARSYSTFPFFSAAMSKKALAWVLDQPDLKAKLRAVELDAVVGIDV